MDRTELERLLAAYPNLLTAGEVAGVLRVHPRSVQRWAQQGRVATVRVGRSYRITRAEVLRWMTAAANPYVSGGEDVGAAGQFTAVLEQDAG